MTLARARRTLGAVLLAVGSAAASDAPGDLARSFGESLVAGRAGAIEPMLPRTGKVRLQLSRLGPESGMFAPGQVVAILRDFLSAGRVVSCEVVRIEGDGKTTSVAVARARVVDREGRDGPVGLRLGFQPEAGRWVLREVKETSE